jgi:hypothetical protein
MMTMVGAVDAGHRAVIFNKMSGVSDDVVGEGTHFMVPVLTTPIIFDVRSRPYLVQGVQTPTKGASLRWCMPGTRGWGRKKKKSGPKNTLFSLSLLAFLLLSVD